MASGCELEVFGGLQALFCALVPLKYRLLWEKFGGISIVAAEAIGKERELASVFAIVFGFEAGEVDPDWIVECVQQLKLLPLHCNDRKNENGKRCLLSSFETPPKQMSKSLLFESIELERMQFESAQCFDWNFDHRDFAVVKAEE